MLPRIREPELMEDAEQARAYAQADFEQPHSNFIRLFGEAFPEVDVVGQVIDLGCGPGDIAIRFARAFPRCTIHGIDGSAAMLDAGEALLARGADVRDRVRLIHGLLPHATMPLERYDAVISNSLLHQLHDPQTLWECVKRFAAPGALVFVMDLRRPASLEEAERLRSEYVSNEPDVLQRDFYKSLLAAFEPEEIQAQLATADLSHFIVKSIGDRLVTVSGRIGNVA
ncbi:MAG: class I SAM-dependent methyltransferase [Verrucomicrobiota bacterium]|nr:class I SAM-dependent methyltransferase [Verrucomicrobiota bacterium]